MKLVVLNDNEGNKGFLNDWGWSIFIDSKYKVLFDANTDPRIIEYNSKKLGVKRIDFGFLSHWHGDHYGGFEYIGNAFPKLKVFVPPGPTEIFKNWNLEPVVVESGKKLLNGFWSTGPIGIEQAMGIETKNGLIAVVGCSHPGVDNLVKKLIEITKKEVYLTIGGFHFPSKKTLDNLAKISKYISPAHCSGEEAKEYVKSKYPNKYIHVRTGSVLEIPIKI